MSKIYKFYINKVFLLIQHNENIINTYLVYKFFVITNEVSVH